MLVIHHQWQFFRKNGNGENSFIFDSSTSLNLFILRSPSRPVSTLLRRSALLPSRSNLRNVARCLWAVLRHGWPIFTSSGSVYASTERRQNHASKVPSKEWMKPVHVCVCVRLVELANGDESTSPVPTLFTVSPIQSILVSLFRHDSIIYGFAWELRKREREVAIVYILCGSTRCLLMFFLLRSTLLQFRTTHHVAVEWFLSAQSQTNPFRTEMSLTT